MFWKKVAIALSTSFGIASALIPPPPLYERDLQVRASTNGSCLSAPDTSCLSLLGLCVGSIVSGKVPSNAFWSDRVCNAAATCAGMGAVLNAACCAGTCKRPKEIASLDTKVYALMVGSCSTQITNCTIKWQPFVDWFYGTIQLTGSGVWPQSGDDVLGWWEEIATWTAFCVGTHCADSAIPYKNFDDYFHFSAAVAVTTPGTPQYVEPLSLDAADNEDDWDPDFSWPCTLDDPDDCWWDYGPPTVSTSTSTNLSTFSVEDVPKSSPLPLLRLTSISAETKENLRPDPIDDALPFGRAAFQPQNTPPPVYVMGRRVYLSSGDGDVDQFDDLISLGYAEGGTNTGNSSEDFLSAIHHQIKTAPAVAFAMITPDTCMGAVDTPAVLPTLTYYCNRMPNICANIRSHSDFGVPVKETMVLTYDPFSASTGRRRKQVCTQGRKNELQEAGKCDLREHNPAYWKVSCDEFPFNSVLEGGKGNVVTEGVPMREQQYQGTLQSSITNLRVVANDGRTVWKGSTGRKCHKWLLRLIDNPELGAGPTAVGSLFAGSAFFGKKDDKNSQSGMRFITDRRAALPPPAPASQAPRKYLSTERNLRVPSFNKGFNCFKCPGSKTRRELEDNLGLDAESHNSTVPGAEVTMRPTPVFDLDKRAASSSCSSTSTKKATSTPEATQAIKTGAGLAAGAAAAASAAGAGLVGGGTPAGVAASDALGAADNLLKTLSNLGNPLSDSDWASSYAITEEAMEETQDALAKTWALQPEDGDPLLEVATHVQDEVSIVSDAMDKTKDVLSPLVVIPPDIDPAKNPVLTTGPPANAPPAACFGAGSRGSVKVGDSFLLGPSGDRAAATLVDAGSKAFFGLNAAGQNLQMVALVCPGVYGWDDRSPKADFKVDCLTMEFGSYWNGVKQQCYMLLTDTKAKFDVICGNNLGNIYSCMQSHGVYNDIKPAFFTWVPT